jgi:hypothetical protein
MQNEKLQHLSMDQTFDAKNSTSKSDIVKSEI